MVAMSRALMMDPSVILLDEPSAGLSPVLQDEVFIRTKQINAAGVTVIMVEQNASRCLQICDRGYVLDQGRNAYTGTGASAAQGPQGDRALPRHPRPGLTDRHPRSGPAERAACAARRRSVTADSAGRAPDTQKGPGVSRAPSVLRYSVTRCSDRCPA